MLMRSSVSSIHVFHTGYKRLEIKTSVLPSLTGVKHKYQLFPCDFTDMKRLNDLFGPSKYLIVLDLFLQNPEDFMNLREVARRIEKNPASVMKVLPILVNRKYIARTKIGAKVVAYQLNKDNNTVRLLQEFLQKLGEKKL